MSAGAGAGIHAAVAAAVLVVHALLGSSLYASLEGHGFAPWPFVSPVASRCWIPSDFSCPAGCARGGAPRTQVKAAAEFDSHGVSAFAANKQESALPQISRIPFVKASAYGNDFLIVRKEFQGVYAPRLTRALCDRHNGVGADGVEWLSDAERPRRAHSPDQC